MSPILPLFESSKEFITKDNKTEKNNEAVEIDETAAHHSLNPTELECFRHCPFLMFATIVTSFGGILFGYDTAALNGILIMPSFVSVMGADGFNAEEWAHLSSWITSSLLLGACIQAGATSWQMMIVGRVTVGLAIGLLSSTVPMYLAEVSPKSIRGSISSLFEVTIAFGILLAFMVTLAFNRQNGDDVSTWRYILGIQAALAMVLFALMLPCPESPRWLVNEGKGDKARAVLIKTRWCLTVGRKRLGSEEWITITNIDLEFDEMCADAKLNKSKQTSWYDFSTLLDNTMLLRTSIGISIKLLQQLTGINSIMYYSSIIFNDIGIKADTTTAVTGLINLVATFISVFLIDRWGRRPLLVFGSIGMCICLLVVGTIILSVNPSAPLAANAIAVFICLFIINFAYSYGPIAWLYPAEIFPIHVRAKGVSVSTAFDWLANFAVSKSVPSMILPGSAVGGLGGTFIFFACWTFAMCLWALGHVHETANLTLENMDDIFGVCTIKGYWRYIVVNFSYTFYFDKLTMYEYTHDYYSRDRTLIPHFSPDKNLDHGDDDFHDDHSDDHKRNNGKNDYGNGREGEMVFNAIPNSNPNPDNDNNKGIFSI